MTRKTSQRITPTVHRDQLKFGSHCTITLQRTLRLPDDGGVYPLPPSLGAFPLKKVEDYSKKVPAAWREHGGLFFPMYQREAMWLNFTGHSWHPQAMKIAVGKINALTGESWDEQLSGDPQDYLVVPNQPWLDGINAGSRHIKQFIAMPLGMGYTVEGQVSGKEEFGGIQIKLFDAVAGRFPDQAPTPIYNAQRISKSMGGMESAYHTLASAAPPSGGGTRSSAGGTYSSNSAYMADSIQSLADDSLGGMGGAEMGLGAGGRMEQKIYPDPYGIDAWDPERTGRVFVHIVNSEMYTFLTGEPAPPTPVSARTYQQHKYPWYALYDEGKGDIDPSNTLQSVKSVHEMDEEHGFNMQDDTTIPIPSDQVKYAWPKPVQDGEW